MKRTLIRAVRILVAAPLFVSLAAGWAGAADAPDAWLTMKTKIALMTTEGVSTSDLNVDTVQGVVTLHGKVPTEGEKARAEATARRVDGVQDVKNLLQVVPASAKKAVVVLLAGASNSLQTHLDAVQAATAVPGVKRVATEVQVTGGT